MNEKKWDEFMISGMIADYLAYKNCTEESFSENGGEYGSNNVEGNSSQGISCGRK